jgi:hypothetical protein
VTEDRQAEPVIGQVLIGRNLADARRSAMLVHRSEPVMPVHLNEPLLQTRCDRRRGRAGNPPYLLSWIRVHAPSPTTEISLSIAE